MLGEEEEMKYAKIVFGIAIAVCIIMLLSACEPARAALIMFP